MAKIPSYFNDKGARGGGYKKPNFLNEKPKPEQKQHQNPQSNIFFKGSGVGKGLQAYRRYLTQQLTGPAEQQAITSARTRAFEDVGRSTEQALLASRTNEARAFGSNIPTGFGAAQRTAIVQRAPYGAANLGAEEAGQRRMVQLGQALQNLGLARGNFYQLIQGLQLQKQAVENSAAVAAASGGGGLFG